MLIPELAFLKRYAQVLRTQLATAQEAEAAPPQGRLVQRRDEAVAACGGTQTAETLPLLEAAAAYQWDALEVDLLLFAAAFRLDPSLLHALQLFSPGARAPLAEHWLRLIDMDRPDAFWDLQHRLVPDIGPFAAGVLELGDAEGGPLASPLIVPDFALAWLRGERDPGFGLRPWLTSFLYGAEVLPPAAPKTQLQTLQAALRGFYQGSMAPALTDLRSSLLLVTGPRGSGKTQAVRWAAYSLGRPWCELDGARLAHEPGAITQRVIEEAIAQAALHHEILLIDDADALLQPHLPASAALRRALRRREALVVLAARDKEGIDRRVRDLACVHAELPLPGFNAIADIWAGAFERLYLQPIPPLTAAERYPLDGRQVVLAATGANLITQGLHPIESPDYDDDAMLATFEHLLAPAAQAQLHEGLGNLGIKEPTTLTLNDLALSEELAAQLHEIMAAFQQRRRIYEEWGLGRRIRKGRGIICLFDGDPGTGKTMCAEVLAATLNLSLIRINTGQIIDKYIGETEKNLSRLFNQAHPGLNLLLFDEADSLFGKRTKVEQANDRYANAAINVLLQLVEGYEGIVVLTTNLKQGIDDAFMRRFSYKLSFELPTPAEREVIWRSFLSDLDGLDPRVNLEELAQRFELAGGNIKNAVVRAANISMAAGTRIQREHLLTACYRELASSGKLVRRDG